jgi:hypothetical protein
VDQHVDSRIEVSEPLKTHLTRSRPRPPFLKSWHPFMTFAEARSLPPGALLRDDQGLTYLIIEKGHNRVQLKVRTWTKESPVQWFNAGGWVLISPSEMRFWADLKRIA